MMTAVSRRSLPPLPLPLPPPLTLIDRGGLTREGREQMMVWRERDGERGRKRVKLGVRRLGKVDMKVYRDSKEEGMHRFSN